MSTSYLLKQQLEEPLSLSDFPFGLSRNLWLDFRLIVLIWFGKNSNKFLSFYQQLGDAMQIKMKGRDGVDGKDGQCVCNEN